MCDFLPRGGTCYILLDYILSGWDFFHFTGTGTVRWRAEGAGLGSQSELSPELMSPSRIRRRRRRSWLAKKRFFYLCLCPHNYWGGGEWRRIGRVGLRGAVPHQSPSTQLKYALQVCFSRRKLFKEVRSPPSIYSFYYKNSLMRALRQNCHLTIDLTGYIPAGAITLSI